MLKRIFSFFVLFFLILNITYSADVDVSAYVYKDYTIFNYVFKFNENDTLNKFSIEKPKDAQISYIVDQYGPVEYTIAGDYFIFKPQNPVENNVFLLKYKSVKVSEDLFITDSFRTYLTFNFPVEKLTFEIFFKEDFGEVVNVFPNNYTYDRESKTLNWNINSSNTDKLFIVNFKEVGQNGTNTNKSKIFWLYLTAILLIISIIIAIILFIPHHKKKLKSLNKKDTTSIVVSNIEDKNLDIKEKSDIVKIEPKQEKVETLEEYIEKHLTDNEKEVVLLIKNHEGISQYDILNHLPKLTKSNLSKIISKLHAKRILKRIKVGKVNKIHLGERFEKKEN